MTGEEARLGPRLQVGHDPAEDPQAPHEPGQAAEPVPPHAEQEDHERLAAVGHPAPAADLAGRAGPRLAGALGGSISVWQ